MTARKTQAGLFSEEPPAVTDVATPPMTDPYVSSLEEMIRTGPTKDLKMESTSRAQSELERIEKQLAELQAVAGDNQEARRQLHTLQERFSALRKQVSAQMSVWQKTELARHPQRPYLLDYLERIFTDFSEIHGDRGYADDAAIVCGMARFRGQECMVVGTQKGRDTRQKLQRNFGMPNPEGYRKALRAMKVAEKFGRPIFTFVDVMGAYPGLGAEERGQAEAIARNLREMAVLRVPVIATITGEGGSGGALALAVADRVLMMENSIYSVISPEGCASIMWRDPGKKEVAAAALKISAEDVVGMGCADGIIPEPAGGAQNDYDAAARMMAESLAKHLEQVQALTIDELIEARYAKFRNMAKYYKELE